MDTDSFYRQVHVKTEDVNKDIANDVEKRFDTSNYETDRPLTTRKSIKMIGLMKDGLAGTIMTEFVGLRQKKNSYLMNDGNSVEKAYGTSKCVIKRELRFEFYKQYLLNNKIILKLQQRFKSEAHNEYTEEINNVGLSCNYDKRLQPFDRITSYPFGTRVGKVCTTKLLKYLSIK